MSPDRATAHILDTAELDPVKKYALFSRCASNLGKDLKARTPGKPTLNRYKTFRVILSESGFRFKSTAQCL